MLSSHPYPPNTTTVSVAPESQGTIVAVDPERKVIES